MIIEWLKQEVTVEEAEEKNMVQNEDLGPFPIPFGYMNDQWLEFKNKIQDGDQIWEFSSSTEEWMNLVGRAGLCIVREGRIVESIVTAMS